MANALYPAGKRAFLNKSIDMVNDTINIALVKSSYSYSATHTNFTTDISTPSYVVGTPVALTSKAVADYGTPASSPANAAFDADDPTFTSVASGDTVKGYVIYHQTSGTLIGFVDTGAGLPFATNNGNVTITFSGGASRIFAL